MKWLLTLALLATLIVPLCVQADGGPPPRLGEFAGTPLVASAIEAGPLPFSISLLESNESCPGNGGWENGENCWYGWLDYGWGPQCVDWQDPYEGDWHLRQRWTDGVVWLHQTIDLSQCSTLHPLWVRVATNVVSGKPEEYGVLDVNDIVLWRFNWTTLVWLRSSTNLTPRGYIDNWYRIEDWAEAVNGLPVHLAFGSSFTYTGLGENTSFNNDGVEFHCMPIGYILYTIHIPIIFG